jgi:dTDP-4-dehydrorhamnose reductase
LALRHGELEITDAETINRRVASFRPDLIVNGAVIQVDEAEIDPAKARAVNVDGPRFLAQAANESGAEILQFSTQYVFEGKPVRRAPYTIKDEPRPVNNYGKTKLAGERAASDACARTYIIRTSWVYGSGKNSFLCTAHDDLLQGKQLRAITDNWSSTTYVEDLIDRSLEIIAGRRYGIYHVVNEGVCTYHEFALEAGRLVGLRADRTNALIKSVTEADMNRPARRPVYTPLRCLLSEELGLPPMRHWKAALAAYVGS